MGWYQSCIVEVTFCKTDYKDKDDIDSEMRDNEKVIDDLTTDIMTLIGTPIRELKEDDETVSEALFRIKREVRDNISEICDLAQENERLDYLKEGWDLRSGDFTYNPDYEENYKKFKEEVVDNEIRWQKEMKEEREKEENEDGKSELPGL